MVWLQGKYQILNIKVQNDILGIKKLFSSYIMHPISHFLLFFFLFFLSVLCGFSMGAGGAFLYFDM